MCGYNITTYSGSYLCVDVAIICPFGLIITLMVLVELLMNSLWLRVNCLALMAFSC